MALKFGPDKRKGNKGRTTINPQIGGKPGDAGPKFQREGAQPRTKITDSRISDSPDAGFSGSKKSIASGSFKAAFAVALAKGPGTIFTFKGKKYKAAKKHEMKGPSASRVEDKKITKATIIKGKRNTTKKPSDKITSAQIKLLNETFKRSAAGKVKKRKAPTPASGKFGQRKAGGIIKAKNGTLTDLAYAKAKAREEGGRFSVTDLKIAEASVNPTILKKAKELAKAREKGGRVSKSDIEMAKSILGKNKKRNLGQRKAGGVIKAGKGKAILDTLAEVLAPALSKKGKVLTKIRGRNKTKKSKEEIDKMFDNAKDSSKNTKKTNTVDKRLSKIINKYPRTTAGAVAVTAAALSKTKNKKGDKGKDKIVGKKRKEKKNVSQADIIGKGSKKGRMAGGMMKKYTKGGMNKYNKGSMLGDLDKDGVMSGYEQKRQDAITTAMGNKNMSGGMAKKKMMGGGMMQYSKGTGKKGVTVQARGCGLARKKPTKMS